MNAERNITDGQTDRLGLTSLLELQVSAGSTNPERQDDNYEQRYGDEGERRKKDKNTGKTHKRNSVRC